MQIHKEDTIQCISTINRKIIKQVISHIPQVLNSLQSLLENLARVCEGGPFQTMQIETPKQLRHIELYFLIEKLL